MSEVDKRVVEMEFDNSKFEKNTKQTMKTIDKLDRKLAFEGASEGLDRVSVKFSAFQVAAISVLTNITNRVINLGIQLVKSLSIDNVAAGWTKFGDKTVSVATMMAQSLKVAGKELTNTEEKFDAINEQLDKLNWFTDETSYNFTDMVDSIGKFTAAGQDLDRAVKAMMGIANWAALSGQNATTASRAMYQLAQSLSKGYVQLIDYKSIQNANMDTQEFRQTILDTAVALGELTRVGDQYITKTGKKFTKNQFAEQLNEKWFTSDVLVKGLEKYSAAVERIYEISNETGLTATQVIARYGDELDEFGLKAFKAAQEARTFSDVINSVKDAVSTGWMSTAENMFGGYNESVKLWTELANALYDMFAEGGNFRNEVLKVWSSLGGRNNLFGEHGDTNQGVFWNIYDSIAAIVDIFRSSFSNIFSGTVFESESEQIDDLGQSFFSLTGVIRDYTKNIKEYLEDSEDFKSILSGVFNVIRVGLYIIKALKFAIQPVVDLVKSLANDLLKRLSSFGDTLSSLEPVIEYIDNLARTLYDTFDELFYGLDLRSVLDNIIESFKNFFKMLSIGAGGGEAFKKIFQSVISIITILGKLVNTVAGLLGQYLLPVLGTVINIVSQLAGFLSGIVVSAIQVIANLINVIGEAFNGNGLNIGQLGKDLGNFFTSIPEKMKGLAPVLKSFTELITELVNIILLIPNILNNISKILTGKGIAENISFIFIKIADAIRIFADAMGGDVSDDKKALLSPLTSLATGIVSVIQGLLKILAPVVTILGQLLNIVGKILAFIGEFFQGFADAVYDHGAKGVRNLIIVLAFLGIMAFLLNRLYYTVYALMGMAKPFTVLADSLSGMMDKKALQWMLDAISNIIKSLAILFASIAGSIYLMSKVDTKSMLSAAGVLLIFAGMITTLLVTLTILLNNSTTALEITKKGGLQYASDNKKNALNQLSLLLTTVSTAMIKFALACYVMSKMSVGQMWSAAGIMVLFTSIIIVLLGVMRELIVSADDAQNEKTIKMLKKTMAAVIAYALGVKIIAKALVEVASMSIGQIVSAGIVLNTIMSSLFAFIFLIPRLLKKGLDIRKVRNVLALMAGMTGSILILALSMKMLASLTWQQLVAASVGISTFLVAFAGALFILSKSKMNIKKAKSLMLAMIEMAGAMLIFAMSMRILSSLSWQQMLAGAVAISAFLLSFAGAIAIMGALKINAMTMIALGAAMVIAAASLIVFATALQQYEDIQWMTIAKGMVVMVGTMAAFTVAAYYLKDSVTTILALGVAMMLISASMLMAAMSMQLFSANFGGFVEAILSNSDAIGEVISVVITSIIQGLLGAFTTLFDSIKEMLPHLFGMLTEFFVGLGQMLIDVSPTLIEALVTIVDSLLTSLDEHGESIAEHLHNLIITILRSLSNHIVEITKLLVDIINKTVYALIEKLPEIVKTIVDFLIELTKVLFSDDNLLRLIVVTTDALLNFIFKLLDYLIPKTFEIAGKVTIMILQIIAFAIQLTIQSLGYVAELIMELIAGLLLLVLHITIGMTNVIRELFWTIMYNLINLLCEVLREAPKRTFTAIKAAFGAFIAGILDAMAVAVRGDGKNPILNAVADWLEKQANSIDTRGSDEVWQSILGGDNVRNALNTAKNNIGNTITDVTQGVSDTIHEATQTIGDTVTDAISLMFGDAQEEMEEDGDLTVTPVMDLSNVEEGTRHISELMNSVNRPTISTSGMLAQGASNDETAARLNSSSSQGNQNGSTTVYNEGDVNNITMNITTDDPQEIADALDQLLQENNNKTKMAHGG